MFAVSAQNVAALIRMKQFSFHSTFSCCRRLLPFSYTDKKQERFQNFSKVRVQYPMLTKKDIVCYYSYILIAV